MSAAEDEETQRRGIVYILCVFGPIPEEFLSLDWHRGMMAPISNVLSWWPIRWNCGHFCFADNPLVRPIADFCMLGWGTKMRIRVKIHIGT